jgi:hypothetical protein
MVWRTVRRIRSSSRVFTRVLALALAVVSAVTCALHAEMTGAQKVCAATSHDCGAAAVVQDCCAIEPQILAGFILGPSSFQFGAQAPASGMAL